MSLERRALMALWAGSGIYLSLGGLSVIRAETIGQIGVLAPAWVLIAVLALCGLAALLIRSHSWSLLLLPALLLPLPRAGTPLIDAAGGANSAPSPPTPGFQAIAALLAHPRRVPVLAAGVAAR
jgi:hypothetical protein